MKKETKSLTIAAQNQSIRTDLVKLKTDGSQEYSLCRLYKKANESIDHVVCGCGKLAYKKYKRRNENLYKIVPWKLVKICDFKGNVV